MFSKGQGTVKRDAQIKDTMEEKVEFANNEDIN